MGHAAPLARYEQLGGFPVLRRSADVSRSGGATLLGIPVGDVTRVLGFRGDFSSLSLTAIARRLRPPLPGKLLGVPVPVGTHRLVLPVALHGDDVKIDASVRAPRGDFVSLVFGRTNGPRTRSLAASVPSAARGGILVGFTLGIANNGARGTVSGGTGPQPVGRGTLELGPLVADGRRLAVDYRRWIGVNGVHSEATKRIFMDCLGINGNQIFYQPVPTVLCARFFITC